jgi:hypothetical protein
MAEKARRSGFTQFTTQFTCFISTQVQILTPEEARRVAILAREEREAERREGKRQREAEQVSVFVPPLLLLYYLLYC